MNTDPARPSPTAVRDACTAIAAAGETVTFTAVAEQTGISRTTLYRRRDLRELIEKHRKPARSQPSLGQLRHALEATAASVRRHEEQIRSLNRSRQPAELKQLRRQR